MRAVSHIHFLAVSQFLGLNKINKSFGSIFIYKGAIVPILLLGMYLKEGDIRIAKLPEEEVVTKE